MSSLDDFKAKAADMLADVKEKAALLSDDAQLKVQALQNKGADWADQLKKELRDAKLEVDQKVHELKYQDQSKDKDA